MLLAVAFVLIVAIVTVIVIAIGIASVIASAVASVVVDVVSAFGLQTMKPPRTTDAVERFIQRLREFNESIHYTGIAPTAASPKQAELFAHICVSLLPSKTFRETSATVSNEQVEVWVVVLQALHRLCRYSLVCTSAVVGIPSGIGRIVRCILLGPEHISCEACRYGYMNMNMTMNNKSSNSNSNHMHSFLCLTAFTVLILYRTLSAILRSGTHMIRQTAKSSAFSSEEICNSLFEPLTKPGASRSCI